jgi:hypothetical protein
MQNGEHWARRLGGNRLRPDAEICQVNVSGRHPKQPLIIGLGWLESSHWLARLKPA